MWVIKNLSGPPNQGEVISIREPKGFEILKSCSYNELKQLSFSLNGLHFNSVIKEDYYWDDCFSEHLSLTQV